MEIKEIRLAKKKMEEAIRDMVTDFNQKYNIPVKNISVEYTHSQSIVDQVNIELESI